MDNNEKRWVDSLDLHHFFSPTKQAYVQVFWKYCTIASRVEHFVKKMIFTKTFGVLGSAIKLSSKHNRQV